MPEWDDLNRPKGYVISVTPGFAQYGQGDERLIYMGLARKITKAARMGFEFAEIDFEALSEMFEPEIAQQVASIKDRQGIEVGLHLPVSMDLCLAHAYQWKFMHRQLKYGAVAGAERMKAKFILFHTSSMARPAISAGVGERTGPTKMAAWNGVNLGNWIEGESQNGRFDLKDWFMAKFIDVLFRAMGTLGDPGIITHFDRMVREEKIGFKDIIKNAETGWKNILGKYEKDIKDMIKRDFKRQLEDLKKLQELKPNDPSIPDTIRRVEEQINRIDSISVLVLHQDRQYHNIIKDLIRQKSEKDWKDYNLFLEIEMYTERYDFYNIYNYWTIHGSECEEPVAYHVVAKWMSRNKDKLYKDIVTASDKDPDQIIYEANTNPNAAPSVIEAVKQIITAVAAKYIEGHLKAKDPKEYAVAVDKNGRFIVNENMAKNHLSILEYCKKHRLHVFIETNMPGTQEAGHGGGAPPGELRIIKATDHIKMVKNIDPDNLSYCMDFEHLLTNYVDPEAEADELAKAGKGDGKYIRCLHTNAPRPVAGAHGPIFPISNDMYILYRYLLKLRKAGCKDAYIIWEMGSYGVRESAIAYRRLVTELLKDTEPDKLPEEFFGIDEVFKALQRTAIKEHAWDPLEGMLQIPEETHTFLGKAAVEKGRGEVWKKERFR